MIGWMFFLVSINLFAAVTNPVGFIGQAILGATEGGPLTVDSGGRLVSGLPVTSYVSVTGTTSAATSASYATMTSLTLSPLAGTYQVHCRTSVTHSTNNADILMAVHVAGVIVSDSISQARPFIQGGLTPSLSVPMNLCSNTEVTVTAGQAITCGWRTTAGTATSENSRSLMISRIR